MHTEIFTPNLSHLAHLIEVEKLAWNTRGKDLEASAEKIQARLDSFPNGITLATVNHQPAGSQYSFRFHWDGDKEKLTSWDEATNYGWINKSHQSTGHTGFLVGVGVIPEFRNQLTKHNQTNLWPNDHKISELLIAFTLEKLFNAGVTAVIANARTPWYHKQPQLSIQKYCQLQRADGKPYDPVLRFHLRMGAQILKPVTFALDDAESLNAGCWVIYQHRFSS